MNLAKVRAVRTSLRYQGKQLVLEATSARTLKEMAEHGARIVFDGGSGKFYRRTPSAAVRVDARVVRTLATRGLIGAQGTLNCGISSHMNYAISSRGEKVLESLNRCGTVSQL